MKAARPADTVPTPWAGAECSLCALAGLAACGMLSSVMPFHKRYYHPSHLQFIATSSYRPAKLLVSERSFDSPGEKRRAGEGLD